MFAASQLPRYLKHFITNQHYFMEDKIQMQTLSYILEKLRLKRQDNDFQMEDGYFKTASGKKYTAEQLTIIKTYRFEGESDPADSSILYVIEADDGLVGYSIDAYGVYSNHENDYDEFMRKIKVHERDEQLIFSLD